MKVLAIGGTGTVGSLVVQHLVDRGVHVRALVRNDESAAKLPRPVEPAIGDGLDPVAVERALTGVDKLYLLNAVSPDEVTQGLIAYGLARKLGIKHVVYHSVFQAEKFKDVPHFASKVVIEGAIKAFGLPYTIVRPNYFFQNDLKLEPMLTGKGLYPTPLGTTGISAVDARDIAEATAVALTTEGHAGKTYNLNGPAPLSGPAAANVWAKLLGKPILYPGENMDAFEAQMRGQMPAWSAFDFRMMFQGYLERGFVAAPGDIDTLTKLLGHAPRRYEDFAQETARAWQQS